MGNAGSGAAIAQLCRDDLRRLHPSDTLSLCQFPRLHQGGHCPLVAHGQHALWCLQPLHMGDGAGLFAAPLRPEGPRHLVGQHAPWGGFLAGACQVDLRRLSDPPAGARLLLLPAHGPRAVLGLGLGAGLRRLLGHRLPRVPSPLGHSGEAGGQPHRTVDGRPQRRSQGWGRGPLACVLAVSSGCARAPWDRQRGAPCLPVIPCIGIGSLTSHVFSAHGNSGHETYRDGL
mmetsp:Transcript_28197/g.71311  ORF Transcript_28197/g.71311 Transcript_28197/m.71311 type:complete len:230 (+) Transcript_28197:300-989(+)